MARALLIIDFQNDFTGGGALAVPDGDAIAPRLNELIDGERRQQRPPDQHQPPTQGDPR